MGPDRGVHNDMFKLLLTAFETLVRIKQINGERNLNTTNLLSQCVNNTMNNSNFAKAFSHIIIELEVTVSDPVEKKRMRWTMFTNSCLEINIFVYAL